MNRVMLCAAIAGASSPEMNRECIALREKIRNSTNLSLDIVKIPIEYGNLFASAVLIPFEFHRGEIILIFTKRATSLVRHSGQISFPGGVSEEIDDSLLDTAIRETQEEIGVGRNQIEILGSLFPFDSTTGFYIRPFIGWIHDLNGLKANSSEVERVIRIPFSWMRNPHNSEIRDYQGHNGVKKKVWFYHPYDGDVVWGITAKIMRDLMVKIEK